MTKNIKILLLALLITSCQSNISKKWSCRKLDGDKGCVSISEADAWKESSTIQSETIESPDGKYSSFKDQNLIRTSDKVGRIWIAPYKDASDNYHEASFVQVVDESSKWELKKVPVITKEYDLENYKE